ncbi:MAG TPA: hypothetical protein PKY81_15575 [bacterium]|nr:hypothetical protein [bacterium]
MNIKKIIWDYNISEQDFLDYLHGKKEDGWFNQEWAIVRAIERLNYYELKEALSFDLLNEKWDKIKHKIWRKDIREGLQFILRRNSVPVTR